MTKLIFQALLLSSALISNANVVAQDEAFNLEKISMTTLLRSPTILQQKEQVIGTEAGVDIQQGVFNPQVYANYGVQLSDQPIISYERPALLDLTHERSYQQLLNTGIVKQFRNGVTADFSVKVYRKDPLNGDDAARAVGLDLNTSNASTLAFTLNIPLLRGAWEVSNAAGEKAAKLQEQAAERDLHFIISKVLLNSISAYWDYKVADDILSIQQDSRRRTQKWLDKAEMTFVLKDPAKVEQMKQKYNAEINASEAYLADKYLRTVQAEQGVAQARALLGVAMGLPYADFNMIVAVAEDFPKIEREQMHLEQLNKQWVELATHNRSDILSTELLIEADQIIVDKYQQDVLPQLDINVGAGYQGLAEGGSVGSFAGSLGSQIPGPAFSGKINFSYPIGNQTQEGLLARQQVIFRQKTIALNDLKRTISAEIDVDTSSFKRRLNEERMAKKAVSFYQPTVKELVKRAMTSPEVTLNLLEYEDRLVAARINYILARSELAKLIAKIRFQTGTLIELDQGNYKVNIQGLRKL
ncbi:MAG: TolC family protein [Methylococcaceae bacterium]|nr:TolC family protein [Methylococcaceae bacterium]